MKFRLLLMLVCCMSIASAQTYTVETVPNTKLVNGSYVSDPDAILKVETISAIDSQLKKLEDSTTVQVAVVMLKSIGDADIFTFAQDLFNTWGIGQKSNDNGLLILYVESQRTIRFHTGDGIEAILPDATCKQIQREYMVPKFKEGDVDSGMLDGIAKTAAIVMDPDHALEVSADDDEVKELDYKGFVILFTGFYGVFFLITFFIKSASNKFRDSEGRHRDTYPNQSLTRRTWLITFGLIPALMVALFSLMDDELAAIGFCMISLYVYFIGTLFWRLARLKTVIHELLAKKKYFDVTDVLKQGQLYWFFIGLIFPVPFFIYFFIHLYRKRHYRNFPRQCDVCKGKMKKLSEKADDEFLSESAQMEEKLKAGDYDVWKCESCQAVEMWFYKNSWSKYEQCPKCKTLALYTKSSRTITSASYTSSGEGERTKVCKFCQHTAVTTYSIPMLTRSESSSSSFSSSSSGGSWGGGSSSGGGASSSW
jgi:uncharacterized protein